MKRFLWSLLGVGVVAGMIIFFSIELGSAQRSSPFMDEIEQQEAISRFDFSRLLLDLECTNCLHPTSEMLNQYSAAYVQQMRAAGRFIADDLSYDTALFNDENYFYCAVVASDKGYMNGYDPFGSTLCAGEFCGENLLTFEDALPGLYAVLSKYVYSYYSIDRNRLAQRADDTNALSVEEQSVLDDADRSCTVTECVLTSTEQLLLYVKYCADHMAECGYQTFPNIERSNPVTLRLNFLVRHQIITRDQAMEIDLSQTVSGTDMLEFMDVIREFVGCAYENDPDNDGVLSENDSCPMGYNPSQYDFDNDGIGDVCDDDIDNDGLTHPLGMVDDAGRVSIAKYKESSDPIIFGDVEEDRQSYALMINAEPVSGRTPLEVKFTAGVVGAIDRLERRFGDGYSQFSPDPTHTYSAPGIYTVSVIGYVGTKRVAYSTMTIQVTAGLNLEVGYQIANSSYAPLLNDPMNLSHIYAGEVAQVTRTIGESIANSAPGELYSWSVRDPGLYYLESQAYNSFGEWVGLSQLTIDVPAGSGGRGSALVADTLTPSVGDSLSLRTEVDGFSVDDIALVLWDFGDETTAETTSLTTSKQYAVSGPKIIQQLISFTDVSIPPHENVITVYVANAEQPISLHLESEKITYEVGENAELRGLLGGVSTSDIVKLIWRFGDGTVRDYETISPLMLRQQKSYDLPGTYPVSLEVSLTDGHWLRADITLQVLGEDICLGDLSGFVCDMDSDAIPDICDDDIDGDGIPNLIGSIPADPAGCEYSEQDEANLGGEDNCSLTPNPDQSDLDGDGTGDGCDSTPEVGDGEDDAGSGDGSDGNDSDGDGIPDSEDACPTIPESENGLEDADGCPELPDGNQAPSTKNPFVGVETCTSCPCPYADYSSAIRKYDRVSAELRDESGSIKYRVTDPAVIEKDIPEYMLGIE